MEHEADYEAPIMSIRNTGSSSKSRPPSDGSLTPLIRGRININENKLILHHVMLLVCIINAYMFNATLSGDLSC